MADINEEDQLTAEEQALKADDDEWDLALNNVYGEGTAATEDELTTTTTTQVQGEEDEDEQANREETTTTTTTVKPNPEDEDEDAKSGKGDDADKDGKPGTGTPSGAEDEEADRGESEAARREYRVAQRDYSKQLETAKNTVREQLYADVPKELQDKDGNPIKSIEDVMQYINPVTQETFTQEDATAWLSAQQQELNKSLDATDKEIEQIADLNLDLRDQMDSINDRYGELFKADPMLRNKIADKFEKTLKFKGEVIVDSPLNMEEFFDDMLAPYVELGQRLESEAETKQREADEAEKRRKDEEKDRKRQRRSDRSDVFGGGDGDIDTRSDDDKEWDLAERNWLKNR